MSRRSKRTPERREVILRCLRAGGTRNEAAGLADMDGATMYRWTQAEPAFHQDVIRAEAEAETRFRSVVVTAALGRPAQYDDAGRLIRAEVVPSETAAMWWLERRRRADYAQRVNVDLKMLVERIAGEEGLDSAAIMAELEDILAHPTGR